MMRASVFMYVEFVIAGAERATRKHCAAELEEELAQFRLWQVVRYSNSASAGSSTQAATEPLTNCAPGCCSAMGTSSLDARATTPITGLHSGWPKQQARNKVAQQQFCKVHSRYSSPFPFIDNNEVLRCHAVRARRHRATARAYLSVL